MTRPNFVFILMDDMGWKDIECYGSSFYDTPHIDRLRAQGMLFTDGYATCPVCSPTRASVMSGKYPANVGVTDWIDWGGYTHPARGRLIDAPYIDHLPLDEKTLPSALRDAGYATWFLGKWHLGSEDYWPERQGFDVNIGGCDWGLPMNGYFSPWDNPAMEEAEEEGKYLPDHLTDKAIKLIEDNGDQPFFLDLSFYCVHGPIQAKDEYTAQYERKVHREGLDEVQTFEVGEHFPCEHKRDKRVKRRLVQSDPKYAAMIRSVDENVGRLLGALEENGLAENTVVVFTSDNGGLATAEGSPTCNLPLAEGKGWMYEGGVREPLLVRWPGTVVPGSTCKVPVTSTDFYPTFLEIAGLEPMPHQHQDGESIVPLLQGSNELDRDAIFWHYPHYGNQGGTPGSSVRAGDYKLIEFFEDGSLELYNLREDIGEENDLSDQKPNVRDRLHDLLTEWRREMEAKMPRPNPEL